MLEKFVYFGKKQYLCSQYAKKAYKNINNSLIKNIKNK